MRDQDPLNICLVSEEYPPDTGWGGIGTYTYNLARGLARIGHRVDVVAGALAVMTVCAVAAVRDPTPPPGDDPTRAGARP